MQAQHMQQYSAQEKQVEGSDLCEPTLETWRVEVKEAHGAKAVRDSTLWVKANNLIGVCQC